MKHKQSNKNQDNDFELIIKDNTLTLTKKSENSSIFVDFTSTKALSRINEQGILKQDICKAIGFNKSKDLTILDCTAGLGRDSFIFASITTKKVTMLERNEISFSLLKDGLKRLSEIKDNNQLETIFNKLELEKTDALEFLNKTKENFDVIYLDPMFNLEDSKKKAKVKKEMAFFHETVGNDDDSDVLLKLALTKANKRVVVKRHIKAPYLNNQKPTLEFKGKTNRFDVYLI